MHEKRKPIKEKMKMQLFNSSTRSRSRKLTRSPKIRRQSFDDEDFADDQLRGEAVNNNSSQHDNTDDDHCNVLRVKLVMSKQQLKQLAAALGRGRSNGRGPALEEIMQHVLLRRRYVKFKVEAENVKWTPELQSIPEEL